MNEEVETVLALVVFEPMYGNTKQVGQKVGQGLAESFHARGSAVTVPTSTHSGEKAR